MDPGSFTGERLRHATPDHLSTTYRRIFIGPVPEGWLKSHRRDWYKHHLNINYSSKAATFTTKSNIAKQRKLTALGEGGEPSGPRQQQSFPQPVDIQVENEEDENSAGEGSSKAIDAKRAFDSVVSEGRDGTRKPAPTKNEVQRSSRGSTRRVNSSAKDKQKEATLAPSRSRASNIGARELSPRPLEPSDSPKRASEISTPPRKAGLSRNSAAASEQENRRPGAQSVISADYDGADESQLDEQHLSVKGSNGKLRNSLIEGAAGGDASTSSLIQKDGPSDNQLEAVAPRPSTARSLLNKIKSPKPTPQGFEAAGSLPEESDLDDQRRKSLGFVHFSVPPDSRVRADVQFKARAARARLLHASRSFRNEGKDGEIVKMDKMLVRIDSTRESLPTEYDENESQRVSTTPVEKWKEFMVVCREGVAEDDSEYVLQMYKTRVIPELESTAKKKKSTHEIPLNKKMAGCNLYSSLDKTIVVWAHSERGGTKIYVMKPHSSATSVEWFTFLRNVLGWNRVTDLPVNVPDLSLNLQLENPFAYIEDEEDVGHDKDDNDALLKSLSKEEAVASTIVQTCLNELEKSPDLHDVVETWAEHRKIGLVWKRYDRLEWIFGENEKKMYGTLAMLRSHDLELRPKSHYPTDVKTKDGSLMDEPAPVEGFLIRLTSQHGKHQRLGKMFYKRLYFSTHDRYLIFSRPAKAMPPPPPRLPVSKNSKVPSSSAIAADIPIIYATNPFPTENGELAWLKPGQPGTTKNAQHHDAEAQDESQRRVDALLSCDGYINLCNVTKVRNIRRGATPADLDLEDGSDVDFDVDVPDTRRDDGSTTNVDDVKTFELVLSNGLVMRLQAFDEMTKNEWKRRLRDLVKYWKARSTADINLYKSVRQQNLDQLNIDEETEAVFGQFARKWELPKSYASPELYNMCGMTGCRSIHMSGTLYRKPHRHTTFKRCSVMLVHGRLLLFTDTMRKITGQQVKHVHHDKISALDLTECYLYSGLLTENDLLYRNRTFDSNKPGHHALPRVFMEDGWTSTDEDYMTCFVIWHSQKKSFFRAPMTALGAEDETAGSKRTKLKRVGQLGTTGRSIVFKARSRAERDHWVLAISGEIERMGMVSEVRVTKDKAK